MNISDDSTHLLGLESLMQCPDCASPINIQSEAIICTACSATFPIQDGIPLMARLGTPASTPSAPAESPHETSDSYQQNYQQVDKAAEYNAEYREKLFKRMSTAREYNLLKRLLSSQGHCQTILDIPSGGGRLSGQMAEYTDLLIEADIALGQVRYGREHGRVNTNQVWMTASAFHLPFRDNSVDGIVCCRLNHHLPTAIERETLIAELLRVARRFVLMTFFDYRSFKNLLRRIRQPFDRQPPKMTMRIEEVKALAQRGGAKLIHAPYLARLSSGHRYALMVKDSPRA